jgi:hypothetical protein
MYCPVNFPNMVYQVYLDKFQVTTSPQKGDNQIQKYLVII